MIFRRFFCFAFLLLATAALAQDNYTFNLGEDWNFRKIGDTAWLPATVPGTVHTDLLANKKIDDPYYGDNEKKLQWIEETDWEYQRSFTLDSSQLETDHLQLVFEGLDTYATIYLNNQLIGESSDMFVRKTIDVKPYLRKGENVLRIVFESAVRKGKEAAKKLRYTLPGDEKVFTRKAQYQYGWDWGPRFVTCGIWRPVRLVGWKVFYMENFSARLDSVRTDGTACMLLRSSFYYTNPNTTLDITIKEKESGTVLSHRKFLTNEGGFCFVPDAGFLPHAKLWWCRGYGEQNLYTFEITIKDSTTTYTYSIRTGLRTVSLQQDSTAAGKSFTFMLNGVPVFCKGANYIPPDNFLPRVTTERYRSIIKAACDANMNMLRVWGGGVYEDDRFYDLCDSTGLLVWQDFMFACAMYPAEGDFVNDVWKEADDNVTRLVRHPCIALWCGNNEIDEGWKNWGWQEQYKYSVADSARIYQQYTMLFNDLLPAQVSLHSNAPYWPSSPSIGWGHPESLQQGDAHYWGVWWGMEPFDVYEKKVGRFMSEYGFQGMPAMQTLRECMPDSSLRLNSAAMKAHQKHPTGFETIQTYLERDYRQPKNFESYVYVSQLLQAEGIRKAIEAHRRAQPYCMGTLYWQLNDCWPVTSWSSIDYAGRWKALHYAVREAYRDLAVSVTEKNDSTFIYVVNDQREVLRGLLKLRLFDTEGQSFWEKEILDTIPPASSVCVWKANTAALLQSTSKTKAVLNAAFLTGGHFTEPAGTLHYFVVPKDLALPKPKLKTELWKVQDTWILQITSNTLAKNVFVDVRGQDIFFSDNFFDIQPNVRYRVQFQSPLRKKQILKKLKYTTLVDSY